jgi:RHS repeat-associated protein
MKTSTDEAGLVTSYAYSSDGRTTTVTRPGGATEVTNAYADGRTASVTGTGVVAQYMSYAQNADGSEVTETHVGGAASPQVERSVADFVGRSVRTERAGFGGTTEVSESFYNAQGQLIRQTSPGAPDTLFAYDALGNPYRTAQDLDGDQQIGLSGVDRVQESETQHLQRSGGIWQETAQRVYATESAGTPTTVSTQRSRLSGFAGGAIAEAESVDVYGNVTASRTLLNASGATVTQLVSVPDSAIPQLTISVQGRVISTTSSTGLTTAFMYDGFGRRTGVMDGRTGTSTTHYDAAGRVDYVEDAAQHRTSFAYELSTGRKIGEVNALGKVTRMAYTMRGELWRTWGDVPYPVEYGYDAQGRRATMRTYRQALPWNDTSWPLAATGDVTTWEYDVASGLLSAKRDAAGQAVQYTYEAGGRLKTRRWARTVSGSPLVTTYNYQPGSGDLAQVDYSDTTPDVTFAYDRVGRTKQVTDGSGVHTLAYDASSLALGSETRTGLVPATLTYKRASSGVLGRSTGVQLGSGYDVTYGYDAQGRVGSVGWSVSGQSDSATYARVAGSELLGGVTYASGLATTYGYEATRDLKTQVKNVAGGATVSQYDYQYDAVGRRGSVVNSGSAFAVPAFSKWNYNDRNELIESARYEGANVGDVSQPVMGEYRAYGFDAIGNRTGASEAGTMKSYSANALNEYTSADGATLTYDVDGNLTNDGARKFTYDAENRLTVVEPVTLGNGAVRVRMAYDYLGRRVQKLVDEYSGSTWANEADVRFVYVGWNVIEERRTSGGVTTKKNFVWGLDLSQSIDGAGGIGGLLAVVDEAGGQMAFLYDANGNVGQLVDEQGAVQARYEYDAFGQTLVASGAAANENAYRFSTKTADVETGLVYYGYRFYSPIMGRWANRDPAGESAGPSMLRFVSNEPTGKIDFDGRIESKLKDWLRDKMYEHALTEVGDAPLARYFLGRYMYGDGSPYVMPAETFIEHARVKASIWLPNEKTRGGTLPLALQSDVAKYCGCSGTNRKSFDGYYRFGAFAGGGFGYFVMEAQVRVTCEASVTGDSDWDLEGDAAFVRDTYDFDWDLGRFWDTVRANYANGDPDITSREPRTAAGSFLPGKRFKIFLERPVRVHQSSKTTWARFYL